MGDLSDVEGEQKRDSHNEVAVQQRDSSEEEDPNGQFRIKDSRQLMKENVDADKEEKEFDPKEFDPRSILAKLPPLPALEAFNKHQDFLANSQSLLAGLGQHAG